MKSRIALISAALLVLTVLPSIVAATSFADQMKDQISGSSITLPSAGDDGSKTDEIIGAVIQTFLSIFGIIFLALTVYGGYKWMIAQGREEEVKKAKDIIRSAIIGIGVVLISYAISVFVLSRFGAATGFQQDSTSFLPLIISLG